MIPVKQAVQEFLLSCQADGLKPKTIAWYQEKLSALFAGVGAKPIDQVLVAEMREYIVSLRTRDVRYEHSRYRRQKPGPISVETLRGHIRALRRFWLWAEVEYGIDPASNPMRRIRMPRKPQQVPKAIDPVDMRAIYDVTGNDLAGIRDRALITFMADTGARAGGVLGLTLDRLDLDLCRAIVIEKYDRVRVVPFGPFTRARLQEWLEVRPKTAGTLFCSLSPGYFGKPLTLSGLHRMLKRLGSKAGVKGRVNPHAFRHGFARTYLMKGGDLGTLSQILGHSDVSVTVASYAVFENPELQLMHQKYSPLGDWKDGEKERGKPDAG